MSRISPSYQGVDPSAPGTIIRVALAIESIFTVGNGLYFIFFPRHYLANKAGASEITETAIQVVQQYGSAALMIGIIPGLLVANNKKSFELRPAFNKLALAFELIIIPLLVWQARTTKDGIPKASLLSNARQFVGFVVWRLIVLKWKPEWFGRWLDGN